MYLDRLAIVILNYNSYDDTVACVDRLYSFNQDYHIIIVDNCSPDGSGMRLTKRYAETDRADRQPRISDQRVPSVDVVISEHNGGYGAGNNTGIHFAEDRYDIDTIAIMNPDVEIPGAGVLTGLYEILHSDASYGMIGGRILSREGPDNLNYSAWPLEDMGGFVAKQSLFTSRYRKAFRSKRLDFISDPSDMDLSSHDGGTGAGTDGGTTSHRTETSEIGTHELYAVDCIAGCFFMIRTECLRDIGYFDEHIFMYNEEDSLGFRLKSAGYTAVLAPDIGYYHNHRQPDNSQLTFRQKVNATRPSYISAKYICRTYYSGRGLFRLWLIEMINRAYLAAAYIKHHGK